jgi:hypothetical protein
MSADLRWHDVAVAMLAVTLYATLGALGLAVGSARAAVNLAFRREHDAETGADGAGGAGDVGVGSALVVDGGEVALAQVGAAGAGRGRTTIVVCIQL